MDSLYHRESQSPYTLVRQRKIWDSLQKHYTKELLMAVSSVVIFILFKLLKDLWSDRILDPRRMILYILLVVIVKWIQYVKRIFHFPIIELNDTIYHHWKPFADKYGIDSVHSEVYDFYEYSIILPNAYPNFFGSCGENEFWFHGVRRTNGIRKYLSMNEIITERHIPSSDKGKIKQINHSQVSVGLYILRVQSGSIMEDKLIYVK